MARSRFAKPEFFDDPVLAGCSHPARLLFVATWQVADRLGVFEWDPSRLRKYAFGYEDITTANVSEMLAELVAGGFLRWADVDGKRYGLVVNLAKHQKFHRDEKDRFGDIAKTARWQSQHPASSLPAPCEQPVSSLPKSLSLENGELRTENGEPQQPAGFAVDFSDDGPKQREVRPTRGFPEAAFEAAFRERGQAAGVKVAGFDGLDKSIAGKLIRRAGEEGITQEALLAEYWRPEWRAFHGLDVRALDKHFAKVVAAIADPKLRPNPGSHAAPAQKPPRARPPSAEQTERKLQAEQDALAAEQFVDDDEAKRRFDEMRRRLG